MNRGFRKYNYRMFETARARIMLVCLLLLGQAALFPLYAVQPVNEDAWVLAGETEFLDDPDRYLEGPVESGGIVQETDPIVVRVDTREGMERVTITGATIEPELGDKVRVYGTLVAPATIDAQNAFVVPQQGRWYAWGISFLAGVWVLARLIRHWTVTWATLGFEPRTEPLTLRKGVVWVLQRWGSDNA